MKYNYFEIDFEGRDYSPIDDYLKDGKLAINKYNKFEIELNMEQSKFILNEFLNELEKKGNDNLVINTAKGNADKKTIYSPNFKNGYFSGIVGVVTGQVCIRKEDLKIDSLDEQNKTLSEYDNFIFNIRLQIKSRLDTNKPYFLATMLLRNGIKLNPDTISSDFDIFYDFLLLFWFKEQLKNAYLKGHFRTYRRFERNDDRLKGSININNHIKWNLGQGNGKVGYSFRENTVNNFMNLLNCCSIFLFEEKPL